MSGTEKRSQASNGGAGGAAAGISMPRPANRAGGANGAQGINFGTVDDQNAVMSSSPAARPSAGEHLQGGNPTAFGSVAAAAPGGGAAGGEKNIGFSGARGPPKKLDFQKLFQGGGAKPSGDGASAQGGATPGPQPAAPGGAAPQPAAPPSSGRPRGGGPKPRPGAPLGPGQMMMPPGNAQSPQSKPMGPMPGAPYAPWNAPMYPHVGYPMTPGGYQYMPQPWQGGYDMGGGPRSPMMGVPNAMSPRGAPAAPGTPGTGPATPSGGPAPGGAPPRPGMPPPRPSGSGQAQGSGTPSGFTMNAGARMFEPPKSRALRIVNPETQRELDLEQLRQESNSASQTSTPQAAPAAPAPPAAASPAKAASPAAQPAQPTERAGTPNEHSRLKTQADFQQKVQRLKEEREKREAEEAAERERAKRAEEERVAAEKRAEEERVAAEKRAAEERAAAEKRAEEERLAAEKRAEEERVAAEKRAAEEKQAEEKRAEEKRAEEKRAEEERATARDAAAARAEEAKPDADGKPEAEAKDEPKEGEPKDAEPKDAQPKDAEPKDAQPKEGEAKEGDEEKPSGPTSIGSARVIDNLEGIAYPPSVQSPKMEFNKEAQPGKYRYDRDFLLQFMSVYTEKPQDLPPLASIGMEASSRGGRRSSGAPGRGGMAMGGRGKTSEERFAAANAGMRGAFGASGPMGAFNTGARSQPLSRGGSGGALPSRETMGTGIPMGGRPKSNRGRQREGGRRENPPEKGGPTIPLDQVVPLANSENRWRPQSRDENAKADLPAQVERKVKSLLNKLTIEKFDSISDQIVGWANMSQNETDGRTLRQVIALVFEKAIDESAWSEMYAQLCAKIQVNISPEIKDEVLDQKEGKEYRGGYLFRKYLLTWCQGDFEKGWGAKSEEESAKKPDKEAEMLSDEYYEAQKQKRRGLGLVQFVGELFKLQMLQPRIMHTCIVRLLRTTTEPEEDEIESVCKLLSTVGYLLDSTSGNHKSRMDVYFKRIDDILQSPNISSRMRFMLMDVVDLRNNNWVSRHDTTAPKTIAEIHAEAAKQQQQKEAEKLHRFDSGPISRGGSRRGQQRGDSHDGWSTVGGGGGGQAPPPRSGRAGDLSAFGKGIDRPSGKAGGGGPQSIFSKKNQGAKGGSGDESSNPPSRTSSSGNMFHLLNQGHDAPQAGGEEPHQRRRLQLQPRSKPLEKPEEGAEQGELSEEELKRKVGNDVKEYLAIRDLSEGVQSIQALPQQHRAKFVDALAAAVLDKKQDSVDAAGKLLAALREQSVVSTEELAQGFKEQVTMLDDTSMDAPSAYSFMAQLLVDSGLPRDRIEALANDMQGEGIKPPKDKLMAKVDDRLGA